MRKILEDTRLASSGRNAILLKFWIKNSLINNWKILEDSYISGRSSSQPGSSDPSTSSESPWVTCWVACGSPQDTVESCVSRVSYENCSGKNAWGSRTQSKVASWECRWTFYFIMYALCCYLWNTHTISLTILTSVRGHVCVCVWMCAFVCCMLCGVFVCGIM